MFGFASFAEVPFASLPVAGASNVETVNETIVLTESQSANAVLNVAVLEAFNLSSSQAATALFNLSVSETQTLTTTQSAVGTFA